MPYVATCPPLPCACPPLPEMLACRLDAVLGHGRRVLALQLSGDRGAGRRVAGGCRHISSMVSQVLAGGGGLNRGGRAGSVTVVWYTKKYVQPNPS